MYRLFLFLAGCALLAVPLHAQRDVHFPDDLFEDEAVAFDSAGNPITRHSISLVRKFFSMSGLYAASDFRFSSPKNTVRDAYTDVSIVNGLQQRRSGFSASGFPWSIGYKIQPVEKLTAFAELSGPLKYTTDVDVDWFVYSGSVTHEVSYFTFRVGAGYIPLSFSSFSVKTSAGVESQHLSYRSKGKGDSSIKPANQNASAMTPFFSGGVSWSATRALALELSANMVFSSDLKVKQHTLQFNNAVAYAYDGYNVKHSPFSLRAAMVVSFGS